MHDLHLSGRQLVRPADDDFGYFECPFK